jgi:hypothetical protein
MNASTSFPSPCYSSPILITTLSTHRFLPLNVLSIAYFSRHSMQTYPFFLLPFNPSPSYLSPFYNSFLFPLIFLCEYRLPSWTHFYPMSSFLSPFHDSSFSHYSVLLLSSFLPFTIPLITFLSSLHHIQCLYSSHHFIRSFSSSQHSIQCLSFLPIHYFVSLPLTILYRHCLSMSHHDVLPLLHSCHYLDFFPALSSLSLHPSSFVDQSARPGMLHAQRTRAL